MENKEKILYKYFLYNQKAILKIPLNKTNKQILLDCIRTIHPLFRHPYAFWGKISDKAASDINSVMATLKKYRVGRFKKIMLKLKGRI